MDRETLLNEYREATSKLLTDLRETPVELFAAKPAADIWSVGQVAEHLMRLEGYTAKVLRGTTTEAGRDPEKRVGIIRRSFESTTRKYSAQGPIVPDEIPLERETLLKQLEEIRADIEGTLTSETLEELCTDFSHEIFGELTRGEWGWFILLHGERHRGQVHRILEALTQRK